MRWIVLVLLPVIAGCCCFQRPFAQQKNPLDGPITDDLGGEPATRAALLGSWRTEVQMPSGTHWMIYMLKDNGKYQATSSVMVPNLALEAKWLLIKHDSGRTEIQTLDGSDPFGKEVRMIGNDTLLVLYNDGTTGEFQRVP